MRAILAIGLTSLSLAACDTLETEPKEEKAMAAIDTAEIVHCWAAHRELAKLYSSIASVEEDPDAKQQYENDAAIQTAEVSAYEEMALSAAKEQGLSDGEIDEMGDEIGDPYETMIDTMELEEFASTITRKTDECQERYPV